MKKSFVWMALMVMVVSSPSSAQRPRYGSMIRFADSAKFFIGGTTPFDNWNQSDTQNFPPAGNYYDVHFRYTDNEPMVMLGLNSETCGTWDQINSSGNFDSTSAPASLVVGSRSGGDSVEKYMNAIFTYGTNMYDMIENAYMVRFELERHSASYAQTRQYAGFLNHSGLVGENMLDAQGTSPGWLSSSVDSTDDTVNAVRVQTGTDARGVVADSFYYPSFLASESPNINQPAHFWAWPGVPVDHKMLCRIRVRVDSLSELDTLSELFANKDSLFTLTVKQDSLYNPHDSVIGIGDTIIVYDTVPSTTQLSGTVLADTSLFHHIGVGYDTIDLHWSAKQNALDTYFQLFWHGKCSLTFDYMEVMTDTFPTNGNNDTLQVFTQGDNWQYSRYRSYNGLTMNDDSTLRQIAGAYVNKYDSLVDFFYMPEELRLGSMTLLKRFAKLVRDSSHGHIECVMTMHDSIEQNNLDSTNEDGGLNFYGFGLPMQYDYYLEGVHLGLFDSSLYADPRYFLVGQYLGNYLTPLPRRKPPYRAMSDMSWDSVFAINGRINDLYRAINPYTQTQYNSCTQNAIRCLMNNYRHARNVCEQASEPNFKHKFIVMWQGGASPSIGGDSSIGQYLWGGGGLRPITAPEMKVMAHLGISSGASGLYLYSPYSNSPGSGINGGVMRITDGFHNSNYDTDSLWNGSALYNDSEWIGWEENYDTVSTLIPELKLYGTQLGDCRYITDYLSNEAYSAAPNASVPFLPYSIRTVNDSDLMDDTSSSSYINKTNVHVSVWVDTTTTTDTFLYITNTRTDDSYDSTVKTHLDTVADSIPPGTFDRRYITMQMKAPHFVTDVTDTLGLQEMGKVRTPYVGVGDSLVVWLLPGDGVLVRLTPAPAGMQQMRVALNYPKPDTAPLLQNFYNHGNIKFSEYVVGVSPHPAAPGEDSLLIPSSLYSYVGIADTASPTLHQDSLLFQKLDATRPEMWRHQNWTNVAGIHFGFKNSLPTVSGITLRPSQTGMDSIAHAVTITTELEDGTMNVGHIRFYDPFFVYNTTFLNQTDTSDKLAPFQPNQSVFGPMYGADSQHYGGVFLQQNDSLFIGVPNYALNAYLTIRSSDDHGTDSLPYWTDYSFLQWHSNDENVPDSTYHNQETSVVFYRDSANYTARYKVHNLALLAPLTGDTGYSFNNQRKFVFIGRDTSDNCWYVNTFTSYGRIYVAFGFHNANNDMSETTWLPEKLISDWNNTNACFPAIAMHRDSTLVDTSYTYDTAYSIVYQTLDSDSNPVILRGTLIGDNVYTEPVSDPGVDELQPYATPVITRVDLSGAAGIPDGSWDVIAYGVEGDSGIAVQIMQTYQPGVSTPASSEYYFGSSTATNPTIWASDSSVMWTETIGHGIKAITITSDSVPMYLAYQELDACLPPGRPAGAGTVWDIYCRGISFMQNNGIVPPAPYLDSTGGRINVSYNVHPSSFNNFRPCISGIRLGNDSTVLGIAYETNQSDASWVDYGEGVAVALDRTGSSWWRSYFIGSDNDSTDYQTKPSISMTRYADTTGGWYKTKFFYSLFFETWSEHAVEHIALNDSTQRVTAVIYENNRNPQGAVMVNGYDSNSRRVALSTDVGNSRWLVSQNFGAFKIAIDHTTLYNYRAVMQRDTASNVYITQGFGELTTDDGMNVVYADIADCPDTGSIDSAHPPSFYMRTEPLTLPESGSLTYTVWLSSSNDSAFEKANETLGFRLDFYDTNNHLLESLDSFSICDTVPKIAPEARTVTLSLPNNLYGRLRLDQVIGANPDSGTVQDIISMKQPTALKEAGESALENEQNDSITIEALDNPTNGFEDIGFSIPLAGAVTMTVLDALGRQAAVVADERVFHAGEHLIRWIPNSNLPTGIYTVVLRYANSVVSTQVAYVK